MISDACVTRTPPSCHKGKKLMNQDNKSTEMELILILVLKISETPFPKQTRYLLQSCFLSESKWENLMLSVHSSCLERPPRCNKDHTHSWVSREAYYSYLIFFWKIKDRV